MSTTTPSPITTELLPLLAPLLARVAELRLDSASDAAEVHAIEARLEQEFPYASAEIQAIGRLMARGVDEGWLADRGAPGARFGRVAKPSEATHELSIDVVSMLGAGVEHSHPRGEITLGFPASADRFTTSTTDDSAHSCHFEGRPPGWVVLAPNSRHVPTVTGAPMNLVYFLPGGAVDWHF